MSNSDEDTFSQDVDSLRPCPMCHRRVQPDGTPTIHYYPDNPGLWCCCYCGLVSSKTLDHCPVCDSTNIGIDTNGFTWCHNSQGHDVRRGPIQWLNR